MLTRTLWSRSEVHTRFVPGSTHASVIMEQQWPRRNAAPSASAPGASSSFAVGFEPGAGVCVKHGAVVARAWTSPNLLAKRACSPSSAPARRAELLREAGAADASDRGGGGVVEVDAPDARELVVARGEHESTGGVETDGADDVRVPRAGSAVGSAAGAGAEASAPAGVRGGGDGGVGVEVGRERDEAVEREVVHADGRAEGDGDERAGGMRRDQRGRRLAHLLLAPALAGAALARASTAALAAATLVPASLASHRDDRASPRESNETCRGARVECAGRRASRARRCDRWPSNGARASRSARAAARGNRGGRSTVSRVFRGIDASHIFRDERSRGGRSDERLGPGEKRPRNTHEYLVTEKCENDFRFTSSDEKVPRRCSGRFTRRGARIGTPRGEIGERDAASLWTRVARRHRRSS